jgi:hypothetical protein
VRHRCWSALVPLLFLCEWGCTLPGHVKGPSWVECLRGGGTIDPNAIVIDTALIERPAGDPYVCTELWQETDEFVVDLETRESLNENGLRVGQLVGAPPAGFQTLLLSKRYCANPERLTVPSGKVISQKLSPVLAHCSLAVFLDGDRRELEIDQARFILDVVPTLTGDGRTRLRFTPKVETGDKLLPFQASPEDSSWVLRIEKPSRRFPEMSWEVSLAPGQYVVIGCRPERLGTLGHLAFVQEEVTPPVQRLLVIRTNRARPGNELTVEDRLGPGSPPPLAVQAASQPLRVKDR